MAFKHGKSLFIPSQLNQQVLTTPTGVLVMVRHGYRLLLDEVASAPGRGLPAVEPIFAAAG